MLPSSNFVRMKLFSSTAPLGMSHWHSAKGSSPQPPQAHLKFTATCRTWSSIEFVAVDVAIWTAGDWPVIGWMGIGCDEVAWIGVIVVVL